MDATNINKRTSEIKKLENLFSSLMEKKSWIRTSFLDFIEVVNSICYKAAISSIDVMVENEKITFQFSERGALINGLDSKDFVDRIYDTSKIKAISQALYEKIYSDEMLNKLSQDISNMKAFAEVLREQIKNLKKLRESFDLELQKSHKKRKIREFYKIFFVKKNKGNPFEEQL